ncbi:hypothetical protein D3C86_1572240 [compost metagenome]
MAAGEHVVGGGGGGDQVAQLGVADVVVGQVADEVRELGAGVQARAVAVGVEVVAGVDQPVGVGDHDGVDLEGADHLAQLAVALNGGGAAAVVRAGLFGNEHRRHVRDLGGENDFTHGGFLLLWSQGLAPGWRLMSPVSALAMGRTLPLAAKD